MLLDTVTRLVFLWTGGPRERAPSPSKDVRLRLTLARLLYYTVNGLLLLDSLRGLVVAFLAFSITKWTFLPFPPLGSLRTDSLYRSYLQFDALSHILLRTGVDPITGPLITVGLYGFFLFLNYMFSNLNDRILRDILTELLALHRQVQVKGAEPFGSINWRQLKENPGAVLRCKVDYLRCLQSGKNCSIQRQSGDAPITLFQYLTVRDQSRMLFWTYSHEATLVVGCLCLAVVILKLLLQQYALGFLTFTFWSLILLLDTLATGYFLYFEVFLFAHLFNRAFLIAYLLICQYTNINLWLGKVGKRSAQNALASNLDLLRHFRLAHCRVSSLSLTEYERYLTPAVYNSIGLLNVLINADMILSLLYEPLEPWAILLALTLVAVHGFLIFFYLGTTVYFNKTVNGGEKHLYGYLSQRGPTTRGRARFYSIEHWRSTVYYERLSGRQMQWSAGDYGPISTLAGLRAFADYIAIFLVFLRIYEKN